MALVERAPGLCSAVPSIRRGEIRVFGLIVVTGRRQNAAYSESETRVGRPRRSSERGSAERLIWTSLALVVLTVMIAGVWSMRAPDAGHSDQLPVFGSLPDFSLVERSGRSLTRADLAGKVWVANFIFTTCPGICPLLSTHMAKLRRDLAGFDPPILSVSMSVDPTHDSPEVLRAYAERYQADPENWLFVTGPPDEIRRLIGEGFLLSVAERSPEEAGDSGELITHSDRFVLVDEEGRIRGYYRGTEEDVVARLKDDITRLTSRG